MSYSAAELFSLVLEKWQQLKLVARPRERWFESESFAGTSQEFLHLVRSSHAHASIWGSGGKLNYINQWTYTYPDPLEFGLAADEMFAMADGQPGQKVMNMTQIIWYRAQTTDKPAPGTEKEWKKFRPTRRSFRLRLTI